jgi:putative SOS response-associated peptidase YedK
VARRLRPRHVSPTRRCCYTAAKVCGRYKISTKAPEIASAFELDDVYDPPARYNVAPTDPVPCVRVEDGRRKLVPMRWGLVPFWAKDLSIGARMINARIESIDEKPAFREAFEKRRCIVVSDGFYEWIGDKKDRRPYLLCFEDRRVFGYAGLWARWKHDGKVVESCSIITTKPNSVAARVHDRMPLILDPQNDAELIKQWLDVTQAPDLSALEGPRELSGFTLFPVDKRVGNVKNDDPSLAEPLSVT